MGIFVSLKVDLPPNPMLSFEASGLSIQSLCGLANGSLEMYFLKNQIINLTSSSLMCPVQDKTWSALNRFKLDEPGTG